MCGVHTHDHRPGLNPINKKSKYQVDKEPFKLSNSNPLHIIRRNMLCGDSWTNSNSKPWVIFREQEHPTCVQKEILRINKYSISYFFNREDSIREIFFLVEVLVAPVLVSHIPWIMKGSEFQKIWESNRWPVYLTLYFFT